MNNASMIMRFFAALIFSLSAPISRAADVSPEELYGAWENIGGENLGISGIIFIAPRYAAYLEKSNGAPGYTFEKYTYSIKNGGGLLDIHGVGWFKIEKRKDGRIILNRTKWIIPHVLSYDGIIQRAKMKDSDLRAFLGGFKLDIEAMKNTPIKNLAKAPLSKSELQNLKKEFYDEKKDISGKIKAKMLGGDREIPDHTIPAEISHNRKIQTIGLNANPQIIDIKLDKDSAVKIAETVLCHIYGNKVLSQKPWSIAETEESYIVKGRLPANALGGAAMIEISKKNGQVLNCAHGK